MPTVRVERTHALGLRRARALARRWADEAARLFQLRCAVEEGADGDVVTFERAGVEGRLEATADRFDLRAELGWSLALLRGRIEREIEVQLDALLAAEAERAAAPKRSPRAARNKSPARRRRA